MQGHSEFNGPKTGGKVTGMGGKSIDNIGAQLVGDGLQLANREFL